MKKVHGFYQVICPFCGRSVHVFKEADEELGNEEEIKCDLCKRKFRLKDLPVSTGIH